LKKIKKFNVVLAILMLALSVFLFYLGATFKIEKKLSYSEEGNIDYKVYLKSNSDYDTPYLGKDRKYIASLIDHIDITYDYCFSGDKDMDYTCEYYILATSTVKDGSGDDSKVIYQKENYLLDNKSKKVSGKKISLSETISINYEEYNKIIDDFNKKYSLSGNNNKLKLMLSVNIKGENSEFDTPINDSSSLDFIIPLTDKTIAIDVGYNEIDKQSEKVEVSSNKFINIVFFAFAVVLALFSIKIIISLIRQYVKFRQEQTYYEKEKSSILNQYGKVISNVDEIEKISLLNFVDVENFADLINIRDCLDKPILFAEIQGLKESAWFVVVDNETSYRYIL